VVSTTNENLNLYTVQYINTVLLVWSRKEPYNYACWSRSRIFIKCIKIGKFSHTKIQKIGAEVSSFYLPGARAGAEAALNK
jgi:hypothetical protein